MMEIHDGNFYNIKIEDCPENVYFDSFGNAHYTGTWVTNKCTKWKLGYVREDIVESLRCENDENCRLLGMSAEREIQLLQKVQQLENQVSCLMQNSESQTQTQIALIKKLEKAKWRPIESAPNDTIVYVSDGMYVKRAFYIEQWNKDFLNGFWTDGAYSDASDGSYGIFYPYIPLNPQPRYWTDSKLPQQPPTTEETKCPT